MRIGLMGFGRIGRNLFRILYESKDIEIVAIDEIADHSDARVPAALRHDPGPVSRTS